MHAALIWASWSGLTVLLNAALTIQSRAKNSSSMRFNFWVSFVAGLLFLASLGGAGQQLLHATSVWEILFALLIYSLSSAVGSTAGQALCLKVPYLRRLEQNNGHR